MDLATIERRAPARWRWRRRILWGLALAALVPAAGFVGFFYGQQRSLEPAGFPVIGVAPRYTLTNQLGQTISSSAFRGKVRIVTFLFPYCTQMCPLIAAHLTNFENLGARPAGIADQVALVAFNLDPENAGPTEMRAFLSQYGWHPDDLRWQFLTGKPAEIRRVVRGGYKVEYRRVTDAELAKTSGNLPLVEPDVVNKLADRHHVDYDIIHNDVIELVDRQGRIRKIYQSADTVGWVELLRDVRRLLVEPSR